jgi:exosortase K
MTPRTSSKTSKTANRVAWLRARIPAAAVYAAGGAVAYGLKAFFSGANADDLRWVLAPTCWLAEGITGTVFTHEAGAGFISHTNHIVVGPACSGLNFLIVCFAALFFSFARRLHRPWERVAWLLASLALAYTATIATNALRVTLAVNLFRLNIYGEILTAARVHRLMGTVLYCASLVAVHRLVENRFAAQPALARRHRGACPRFAGTLHTPTFTPCHQPLAPAARRLARLRLSPFIWYIGVAVIIPLGRRSPRGLDGRFAEHAATVVGTVLLLIGLAVVARTLADRLQSKRSEG